MLPAVQSAWRAVARSGITSNQIRALAVQQVKAAHDVRIYFMVLCCRTPTGLQLGHSHPKPAIDLISEIPPKKVPARGIWCDGGVILQYYFSFGR